MQKASLPMPLLVGSSTVSAIAVASTASTALPPFIIMRSPACAASGCEVETTLRASVGMRCDGYGNCQSKGFIRGETECAGGANYTCSPPRAPVRRRRSRHGWKVSRDRDVLLVDLDAAPGREVSHHAAHHFARGAHAVGDFLLGR